MLSIIRGGIAQTVVLLKMDDDAEPKRLASEREVTDTLKESNAQRVERNCTGLSVRLDAQRMIRNIWTKKSLTRPRQGEKVPALLYRGRLGLRRRQSRPLA
jgi:hypothetical protein